MLPIIFNLVRSVFVLEAEFSMSAASKHALTLKFWIGNNLLWDLETSVAVQGHQGKSNYTICLGVISP